MTVSIERALLSIISDHELVGHNPLIAAIDPDRCNQLLLPVRVKARSQGEAHLSSERWGEGHWSP